MWRGLAFAGAAIIFVIGMWMLVRGFELHTGFNSERLIIYGIIIAFTSAFVLVSIYLIGDDNS